MKSETKIKKTEKISNSAYTPDSGVMEHSEPEEVIGFQENESFSEVEIDSEPEQYEQPVEIPVQNNPPNIVSQPKENIPLHKKDTKKYQTSNLEDDIFDEKGNLKVNNKQEEINEALTSIKSTIAEYSYLITKFIQNKIINKIFNFFERFLLKAVKPVISFLNKVFKFLAEKVKIEASNDLNKSIEEEIVEEIEYHKSNFNTVRDINITFTDNYGKALYQPSTNNQSLTKLEEELIFNISVEAIKQCAEFMKQIPPPKEGMFQDIPMYDLMMGVRFSDIELFLGYVSKRPKKYACQKWKISETYATWLMNNTPLIEVKG